MEKTERIRAFVNDLARTVDFSYDGSTTVEGLEKMKWVLSDDMMQNKTKNPKNEMYFTEIDGTGNLSTVINAPLLLSNGHFYSVSSEYG